MVSAPYISLYIAAMLLLLSNQVQQCLALVCNYCYQADAREDCHINTIDCKPDYVCTVETSLVSYKGRHVSKVMPMYKMGCEHHSLCRDRVSSGVGPYGYSVVTKICCCNHRCEEPDGVGKRILDNCPQLWENYTNSVTFSAGVDTVKANSIRNLIGWVGMYWIIIQIAG